MFAFILRAINNLVEPDTQLRGKVDIFDNAKMYSFRRDIAVCKQQSGGKEALQLCAAQAKHRKMEQTRNGETRSWRRSRCCSANKLCHNRQHQLGKKQAQQHNELTKCATSLSDCGAALEIKNKICLLMEKASARIQSASVPARAAGRVRQ